MSAVALVSALALVPNPATARTTDDVQRSNGKTADAWWISRDDGPHGNYHQYSVSVSRSNGTTDVYVYITDWDCPPGEDPYGDPEPLQTEPQPADGREGTPPDSGIINPDEPPYESPCTYIGSRWGNSTDMSVTFANALASAHVVGDITLTDEQGNTEQIAVDLTFQGSGPLHSERSVYSYSYDGERSRSTYARNFRDATVSGTIGDVAVASDGIAGQIASWRSTSSGNMAGGGGGVVSSDRPMAN